MTAGGTALLGRVAVVTAAAVRVPGRVRPPAPFVVGVPRSGTTLLRLMLDSHPELAIPAETHFIPKLIARWRKLDASDAPADERRHACLELITSHRRWDDLEVDAGDLEAHLAAIPEPSLADVARAVHIVHAQGRGKPRWGDKTPSYLTRMRPINRALPEARFVHVIRDGRDVAVSLTGVSWGPDDVAEAAERWKRRIRTARRQARRLPVSSYTEVRYEELVADPEPVLRRIAGFAGLAWDDAMLTHHEGAAERIAELVRDVPTASGTVITAADRERQHALATEPPRTDRIGRWRTEMEPADLRLFEQSAGELLEELGYPVEGVARG